MVKVFRAAAEYAAPICLVEVCHLLNILNHCTLFGNIMGFVQLGFKVKEVQFLQSRTRNPRFSREFYHFCLLLLDFGDIFAYSGYGLFLISTDRTSVRSVELL